MIQQRGVRPQWRRFVLPVACTTLAFLAGVYAHLTLGENLIGPYTGGLNDHSECIQE